MMLDSRAPKSPSDWPKEFAPAAATSILLGLVTSPISYFSTFTCDVHGALMVTGSHNPPEYNGFKVSVGKTTIFGDEIQELRKIMERKDFVGASGRNRSHRHFSELLAALQRRVRQHHPNSDRARLRQRRRRLHRQKALRKCRIETNDFV